MRFDEKRISALTCSLCVEHMPWGAPLSFFVTLARFRLDLDTIFWFDRGDMTLFLLGRYCERLT
jgi:hypothetical protein